MARPKRFAHPDANQQQIVDGLRACGYIVHDVSRWMAEYDLLVWGLDLQTRRYGWKHMEVKTADGTLTATQRRFMEANPGAVFVVRSLMEALDCFGRTAT